MDDVFKKIDKVIAGYVDERTELIRLHTNAAEFNLSSLTEISERIKLVNAKIEALVRFKMKLKGPTND